MLNGIYSAASAMRLSELSQEVSATNLAHMNVPGFRKSYLVIQATASAQANGLASPPAEGFGPAIGSLETDFTPGPVVETGRSLDLAIAGDGFFALQGPQGTLYTRNGSFHIGEGGTLVTADGLPVLGEGGPITIPPNISPDQLEITMEGAIMQGNQPLGQFQLVRFDDLKGLVPLGTTLFGQGSAVVGTGEVLVRQGAREQSNVAAVDELVQMIVNMRNYEAAQRTLRTIDDTVKQRVNPRG